MKGLIKKISSIVRREIALCMSDLPNKVQGVKEVLNLEAGKNSRIITEPQRLQINVMVITQFFLIKKNPI